jgi:hypothetical protein
MAVEVEMKKYHVCPDCGWQWWVDEMGSTSSLHRCKNGNMVCFPEPSPSTNAHVNPVMRNILNNFFRGVYNQEETINLIAKEIGYESVPKCGGSPCEERPDVQTMQSPDKNAKG